MANKWQLVIFSIVCEASSVRGEVEFDCRARLLTCFRSTLHNWRSLPSKKQNNINERTLLYSQWAVKVDEALLENDFFRYLTLIRFYLHLMLVLWYSRSPNSMVYTCNHDDLVEIIEDIDLEGSLYPRNGMRRVFPWVLERQRIETLFGTKKNQLQIRTNNVKTDKIFVGLSRNSKKWPYLPYFRKEIRQTTWCAKMTSGLVLMSYSRSPLIGQLQSETCRTFFENLPKAAKYTHPRLWGRNPA